MKIQLMTICILITVCLSGCWEKIFYDLETENRSNEKLYNCTILEFEKYIPSWSGHNPGTGGNVGPITIPVPDRITITWKSIILGKEEEAALYKQKIDAIEGVFMSTDRSKFPKYTRFPKDLYEDHEVILTLKGIVPKKPNRGEIIITYTGNEHFDVQWRNK